jgi:hypothetical protein
MNAVTGHLPVKHGGVSLRDCLPLITGGLHGHRSANVAAEFKFSTRKIDDDFWPASLAHLIKPYLSDSSQYVISVRSERAPKQFSRHEASLHGHGASG